MSDSDVEPRNSQPTCLWTCKIRFRFWTGIRFYDENNLNKIRTPTGMAISRGMIRNRQDLLAPCFSNKRKGCWQNGSPYLRVKTLIDSLFAPYDASEFAGVLKAL